MKNRISTVVATAMLVTLTSGCCANMSTLWFGRGARCGACNPFSRSPCACNGLPRPRCGLCNMFSKPQFGNVMQAPCCTPPHASPAPTFQSAPCQAPCGTPQFVSPAPTRQSAPCQAPQWQQPTCQSPTCQGAPAADCGCNDNHYSGESYGEPCGTCHSSAYGDCGCGQTVDGYAGNVHDPYLSGGSYQDAGSYSGVPSDPYPGQVINGEVVVGPGYTPGMTEGQVLPGNSYPSTTYPSNPAPVLQDNFDPRPIDNYPGQSNYQSRKFDTDGNKILWEEPLPAGANAN